MTTHLLRCNLRTGEILDASDQVVGRVVPVEPTEAQWGGLARDIVMWMDMGTRPTPETLFKHLERIGRNIPQWLRDEREMQHMNHVPSKGTRAVIIYRAMLSAATLDLEAAAVKVPDTHGFDGVFAAGMQHVIDALGVKP
jgi:hypothetical protein